MPYGLAPPPPPGAGRYAPPPPPAMMPPNLPLPPSGSASFAPPSAHLPPRKPVAFVAAAAQAAQADEASTRPSAQDAARRFEAVPDALRDALRKLEPSDAEPALAFFALDFGGRVGSEQVVLETEEGGAQIVLKLDFDGQTWKRVRKKGRA